MLYHGLLGYRKLKAGPYVFVEAESVVRSWGVSSEIDAHGAPAHYFHLPSQYCDSWSPCWVLASYCGDFGCTLEKQKADARPSARAQTGRDQAVTCPSETLAAVIAQAIWAFGRRRKEWVDATMGLVGWARIDAAAWRLGASVSSLMS